VARASAALAVPAKVRLTAEALGEAGRAWLEGLPDQLDRLARDWDLDVGAPAGRGSEGFVAAARTAEGREAMLKIVIPGLDPQRLELRILRAAEGVGYARLLRSDAAQNVMLLERLGPQLAESGLAMDAQLQILCRTLREAWACPRPGDDLPTGADRAAEMARLIEAVWAEGEGPCSRAAVDAALACAERRARAFDPARAVVAHGDAHPWNTLAAPGAATGYKFVDPDGGFAEPAFDLGIPMREWGPQLPDGDLRSLGEARCRLLSAATGVAAEAIWDWGVLQCVWNGLSLTRIGADDAARLQLTVAEAFAAPSGGGAS
jgi:streptomycin 6-kinase